VSWVTVTQVCAVISWCNTALQAYNRNVPLMVAAMCCSLFASVMAMVVARQRMHLKHEEGYLRGLNYIVERFPDLEITLKKKNEHGG